MLVACQQKIEELCAQLDGYNVLLSIADTTNNLWVKLIKEAADLTKRMLIGVGSRCGKDSTEYEAAGGVCKSEEKKPTRRTRA